MKKVNILSLDFLREWLGIYFPDVTVWIPLPSVEVSDGCRTTVLDIYYARFKVKTGQGNIPYFERLAKVFAGELGVAFKIT